MGNKSLIIVSTLLSIFVIYTFLFIYTFINFDNEFRYVFKTKENLNFHKKYSENIHHIREERVLNLLFKKAIVEDLLFTKINEINEKEMLVLFQGDSWMEQITFPIDKKFISVELVQKFGIKKKIGFVNAGISSFSPSLMNIQLDVLEQDFEIFPNLVVAYIDQTDIGDENCRYKNNKIYKNEILKSIQPETYLMYKDLYNYSEIYALSEIFLESNPRFIKTFKLINYKFKYNLIKSSLRFYRKNISKSITDKEKIKKCYAKELTKYLTDPSDEDIKYFSNSIKEYLKKIDQKKHIKKLFLVTFPHQKHFYKKNDNSSYRLNVSEVVDKIIEDKKNITHINFSKILLNDNSFDFEEIWLEDKIHLKSNFHGKLFMKKILDELSNYLLMTN